MIFRGRRKVEHDERLIRQIAIDLVAEVEKRLEFLEKKGFEDGFVDVLREMKVILEARISAFDETASHSSMRRLNDRQLNEGFIKEYTEIRNRMREINRSIGEREDSWIS
jgi:hypothetical protein